MNENVFNSGVSVVIFIQKLVLLDDDFDII